MTPQPGDVVIYLRSGRRAVVDVIDHVTTMDGSPNSEFVVHLAEQDEYVKLDSFISVTQVCRDIAELGQMAVAVQAIAKRMDELTVAIEEIRDTPKTIGKRRGPQP